MCIEPLSSIFFNFVHRYVHHPENNKVTNDWLSEGEYEIEAMGIRYPATLHLKSPFDAKNMRINGEYEDDDIDFRYHVISKV